MIDKETRQVHELKLWALQDTAAVDVPTVDEMASEIALEDVLVRNPGLLEPGIRLVGRQTPSAGGPLDLLGVDQDGRLVVFELKRGKLARDAVTQVLDYASALNAMDVTELVQHISERSGTGGIARIDDFQGWYLRQYSVDDLSQLLPPRMVLVGLGVDEAAERMARFVSSGTVDLSVITMYGFRRQGEILLARHINVEPRPDRRGITVREKRRQLRDFLATNGYAELFQAVTNDIREELPGKPWEEPGRYGVGFQINVEGVFQTWFGVYAGYLEGADYSVSILPSTFQRCAAAQAKLEDSVDLKDWPHGGRVLSFHSSEEWDQHRDAVIEFVRAVSESVHSTSG